MEITGFKTKIKDIEKLFNSFLKYVLSFAIGYTVSKAELKGDISPFSLSVMALTPNINLSPMIYYFGSFIGFITKDYSILNYKYILANSLLFIVMTILGTKRYYSTVFTPVIPSVICFGSGFLFLFAEKITVYSVIVLLCESVLCGCLSFFISFCFDGFKRKCKLDSKDVISLNITLIIVICALDNYYLIGIPISFVFVTLLIYLTCYYFNEKNALLFNITLCAVPAVLHPDNGFYFVLLYLPSAVAVLISKYSKSHIVSSYYLAYIAIYIANLQSLNYIIILAPAISSALFMLLPKKALADILCNYFELKTDNTSGVDNKLDLCEKYSFASAKLTKLINNNAVKPMINVYNENKLKRYLHLNRCRDVKISNYYNEFGRQIVSISCKSNNEFSFQNLTNKLCSVCDDNFILSEKSFSGNNIFCKFEQADLYKVECYALCKSKNGETLCGDTVTAFRSPDGYYNIILADGMGSGKDAYSKSNDAVVILKKLLMSGVESTYAVDTVNSSLEILKDEIGFSTIDLCCISLNDLSGHFIKCGAYKSYIVRKNEITTLGTGGFPAGLYDEISYIKRPFDFKPDDIIIMMSDGVSFAEENIQAEILLNNKYNSEILTRKIIDVAFHVTPKEYDDDMTVLVAKITKRTVE